MRAARHSISEQDRNFLLMSAFSELQYTVNHTPRTHELLPEMLTRQGMILRQVKKPRDAIPLLEDSIDLNPKYWRAYLELSRCHIALGDKRKAKEVLEAGLTQVPDAKALHAMLQTLGATR